MKITNIDQAKDLFEALDYHKDKLESLSKLNVDQVEIDFISDNKTIVFPQSYWVFNEAIIANIIVFSDLGESFFFLVLPMPPIAILLGIIGIVKDIKNKSNEMIFAICGILGGIIPIIRFLKFIEEVSSISG